MNIDKLFIAKLVIITEIKYSHDENLNTLTTIYSNQIKNGVFYYYDDDQYIDVMNNHKYDCKLNLKKIGDVCIDPRTLIPLSLLFSQQNIEIPNNISKRKIKKLVLNSKSVR